MKISKENADKCFILLAGVTGTFILLMADLCTENPTVYKAGNLLSKHLDINKHNDGSINYVLLLLILFMGLIICWVHEPKTKVDAFFRGMSIFAVLSLAPPVEETQSQPVSDSSTQINHLPVNSAAKSDLYIRPNTGLQMPVWSASYTEPRNNPYTDTYLQITTNATVRSNDWVSSTRPEEGSMTFLNNAVNIQKIQIGGSNLSLPPGTKVQVIDSYDTPLRSYRYLHIRFNYYGRVWDGWIYSGKKPNYYACVSVDGQ
jgi:hypothetical protein